MPTRVWLLRHAESAVPTVFHGAESDIGLSDRGRRRVDALVPDLAAHNPDAVVSSGMQRAILTALIREHFRTERLWYEQLETNLVQRQRSSVAAQPS